MNISYIVNLFKFIKKTPTESVSCFGMGALIYLFTFNAYSQNDCGTKPGDKPFIIDEVKLRQARVQYTSPLLIKIFVNVFADDDGTNRAVEDTTVFRQLENTQNFYSAHGICFILGGIRQLNSTDLNSQDADNEETELLSYIIGGHLNIFVHATLFDTKGGLNGNAYHIPGNYISVSKSALESTSNLSTTAHEIGHNFGLYHTFEKNFGVEAIPRFGSCTNCSTAGDLLCDTPADPHSDTYDTATRITNCNFNGTITQECNGTNLSYFMDPENIMAYGVRACRNMFTAGQGSRARNSIITTPSLQNCIAPDNEAISGNQTITSGRQYFLARNTINITASAFTINGSAIVMINGSDVNILPGTTFNPNTGNTTVKVNDLCN